MSDWHKAMNLFDILLESLKRSGACGADLLKNVETGIASDDLSRRQELLLFSLIPGLVLALIACSYFLEKQGGTKAEIAQTIAITAIFIGGGNRFWRGIKDLFFQRRITVDVFVTVSLTATMIIGEFLSAAIIIFIIAVAGAVEGYTLSKSSKSIHRFLSLVPQSAHLITGDGEIEIEVNSIKKGNRILIKPGERIPVDGIVLDGNGDVNESPITGEAMPVSKSMGSNVYAGTLNETGRFLVEVATEPEDTIAAQIIKLVNAAESHKASIQRLVDTFTAWYLPIILVIAGIGFWITKSTHDAVSILLIAAPCALAIGTPAAVSAAMANMSKKGVMIKGADTFEQAGKINTLMIDKTGTLTTGMPAVAGIVPVCKVSEEEILCIAASAEKDSVHPFAKAILEEAKKRNIRLHEVDDFISVTAMGVRGKIQGKTVLIGKNDWVNEQIKNKTATGSDGRASVSIAMDGEFLGEILFIDPLRPDAKEAVRLLKDLLGDKHLAILSGDQKKQTALTGEEAGIPVTYGDLLPADKEQLIFEKRRLGHKVAMIGDGINDAPALAAADIGIAMGVCGTKFAAETADVVLMREELSLIAEFIKLSRVVIQRIKLNIFFSIIFNLIGITLGYFGLLNPVLAIILQEAATMTVLVSSALLITWNSGFSGYKTDNMKEGNTIG